MTRYWAVWFAVAFGTFIVPEVVAIARNRTQDTLSGAIWAMEKLQPGQGITKWTFGHFAFTSVFLLAALWLAGHFGWGWWR